MLILNKEKEQEFIKKYNPKILSKKDGYIWMSDDQCVYQISNSFSINNYYELKTKENTKHLPGALNITGISRANLEALYVLIKDNIIIQVADPEKPLTKEQQYKQRIAELEKEIKLLKGEDVE